MIMVAEKSHSLLCARWRPRKAGGRAQSKFRGLKTKGAETVNPGSGVKVQHRSTRVQGQEDRCSSSSEERIGPSSAFLFYLGP